VSFQLAATCSALIGREQEVAVDDHTDRESWPDRWSVSPDSGEDLVVLDPATVNSTVSASPACRMGSYWVHDERRPLRASCIGLALRANEINKLSKLARKSIQRNSGIGVRLPAPVSQQSGVSEEVWKRNRAEGLKGGRERQPEFNILYFCADFRSASHTSRAAARRQIVPRPLSLPLSPPPNWATMKPGTWLIAMPASVVVKPRASSRPGLRTTWTTWTT
jgi:hypothetical protein